MSDAPFRCYDRIPADVLRDTAGETAVAANPTNGHPAVLEAAGEPARFWLTGTALRVLFLDGAQPLRTHVMRAASAWTEHANLDFTVVDHGPAEIRVSFAGDGNWSALGTDALVAEMFLPGMPTMCLSEVPQARPARLDRLARHEFGHAIGLIHEHSSPASEMRWNKDVVYAELAGPPNHWTRAQVEFNVFHRYRATTTQYTAFDPESVMLYSFPPSWTKDKVSHRENTDLSATDKAFVRQVYAGRASAR